MSWILYYGAFWNSKENRQASWDHQEVDEFDELCKDNQNNNNNKKTTVRTMRKKKQKENKQRQSGAHGENEKKIGVGDGKKEVLLQDTGQKGNGKYKRDKKRSRSPEVKETKELSNKNRTNIHFPETLKVNNYTINGHVRARIVCLVVGKFVNVYLVQLLCDIRLDFHGIAHNLDG